MKKLICCALMLALLLSMSAAAFADIANEHIDDFYWRNTRKFDYSVSGYYYVNSPDGYVSAWASPSALKFIANIPNGRLLSVQARYGDWATAVYLADGKYVEGNQWIPLEYLTPMYSSGDFVEEFGAETDLGAQAENIFEDYEIKDCLCFYSYPGSGSLCSELFELWEDEPLNIEALYIDGDGLRWGYCSYYGYNNINGWICIDQPENSQMPITLDRNPEYLSEPRDIGEDELPRLRYDYIISAGVYIGAAAAGLALLGAAVLIYRSRRKRDSAAADSGE